MLAAVIFGLAVHWRLWPIIFALPILRHFALCAQQKAGQGSAGFAGSSGRQGGQTFFGRLVGSLVTVPGVVFGLISGAVFLGLAALFYSWYGQEFLHETYLYHATRTGGLHHWLACCLLTCAGWTAACCGGWRLPTLLLATLQSPPLRPCAWMRPCA